MGDEGCELRLRKSLRMGRAVIKRKGECKLRNIWETRV